MSVFPSLLRVASVCALVAFSGLAATLAVLAARSAGAGQGALATEEGASPSGDDSGSEVAETYTVTIEGVERSRLKGLLEKSSQLIALRDRPTLTAAGLVRRIERDVERFRTVLQSEGYYAGDISYRLDSDQKPIPVTITVSTGPAFRLQSYYVEFIGDWSERPPPLPTPADVGLELGKPARAADIVSAETRLLNTLANQGWPLGKVVDRRVTVDHATNTVAVRVEVDSGPEAYFGPVTIEGLTGVREDYVRTIIPWSAGDRYDQAKVNTLRSKLLKTGLFNVVDISHGDSVRPDGRLPITLELIEAKHRFIGVGAKYSTSEGPSVEVSWEHRNLLGRHEQLELSLEVGQITQEGQISFMRPDFRRAGQDLLASVTLTQTNSEAFDETSVEVASGVRRPLNDTWKGSIGGSLEWSRLTDEDGSGTSTLVGVPVSLMHDSTDDRLNPTKGYRLTLTETPYVGWFDAPVNFFVTEAIGSAYAPLDNRRRFVLAGRTKVGSIVGEPRKDIPANKRFYAGGGDSIRGYQFQKVGPLDENNDPIGGRSLFEVVGELRTRVWGNFGLVFFGEGGNVFDEVYPDFSQAPRWAAGVGVQYFTAIGPVRIDFAFPLNRRENIDDPFQFYISLGQAF